MRYLLIAWFALFAAACTPAAEDAHGVRSTGLDISGAWAGPTPEGVNVAAGYLTIANTAAEADQLIAASSRRAGRVEIHEMIADGAVMRMRRTPALEIPAGGETALAPGGAHLMFFEVDPGFSVGEMIPVRLVFQRGGEVDVDMPVRARGAAHGASH